MRAYLYAVLLEMAQVGQRDLGVVDGEEEVGVFLSLIGHVGCGGADGLLCGGCDLVSIGAIASRRGLRRIRLHLSFQASQHLQAVPLIYAIGQRVRPEELSTAHIQSSVVF